MINYYLIYKKGNLQANGPLNRYQLQNKFQSSKFIEKLQH